MSTATTIDTSMNTGQHTPTRGRQREAQRRLGTLSTASDYPQTLDGLFDLEVSYPTIEPQTLRDPNRLRQMVALDFEQIQAGVGELLVDRPRRNILRRAGTGGVA